MQSMQSMQPVQPSTNPMHNGTNISSPEEQSKSPGESEPENGSPALPPSTDQDGENDHDTASSSISTSNNGKIGWYGWYVAFKNVLPVYISIHLAFFVITCLSVLFVLPDFSWQDRPLYTLWQAWHHWDTGNYMSIALNGYNDLTKLAFFPLYPMLEAVLTLLTHNALISGLIISDVAGFGMLIVLYRLVEEDFDSEQAARAVLYISIFPTAFFLAAGYNESLFILLSLLSFYSMRHGNWWIAGLFGLFASLTRSVGVLLFVPFCYEYLRQHDFRLKSLRFDMLTGLLIPAGIGLYALYGYIQFHDPLAITHAEANSNRSLHLPWSGVWQSIQVIQQSKGLLGFTTLRNLTDLVPDIFVLVLLILAFVGPWRLPRRLLAYGFYAVALFLFFQLFPHTGTGLFPLESLSRYLLEIFPAFIILATIGKYKLLHMNYLMISGAILFFLLTQFLTGHWVL